VRRIQSKRRELLEGRAAAMRSDLNGVEAALWRELGGSTLGVAFRRQVVVGEFIADFMAPSVKLIVEVDGRCHAARVRRDARRDKRLARLGFRVLRLPHEVVLRNMPAALAVIREAVAESGGG
jgi:very-short-patch-repair endonuclease